MKKFFSGFKKGFELFGSNITCLVNTVLLTAVYIVGVGLTFLVSRIFKKRFLETKVDKKLKTYWSELNLKTQKIEEYLKQY
jgi:cytochrome c biogenesis protein CcdA